MLLDFHGSKYPVDISDENSVVSPSTGKPLRVLKVWLNLRGRPASDHFLSLLNQSKPHGIASVDEKGEVQKQWRIGNTSWQFRDSDPTYTHSLELTEVEDLKASSLTLGSITLQPYKYEETFDGERLNIEAKVVLTVSQHALLRDLLQSDEPFPVVRHGINETPLQMQFGASYWSQHGDDFKHNLFLWEEREETKLNRLAQAFLWTRALRGQVAENTGTIDSLLAALLKKSILTQDEVADIKRESIERSREVRFGFWRVDDVDEL